MTGSRGHGKERTASAAPPPKDLRRLPYTPTWSLADRVVRRRPRPSGEKTRAKVPAASTIYFAGAPTRENRAATPPSPACARWTRTATGGGAWRMRKTPVGQATPTRSETLRENRQTEW